MAGRGGENRIGQLQQHIGVTRLIEPAPTRQVLTTQLENHAFKIAVGFLSQMTLYPFLKQSHLLSVWPVGVEIAPSRRPTDMEGILRQRPPRQSRALNTNLLCQPLPSPIPMLMLGRSRGAGPILMM